MIRHFTLLMGLFSFLFGSCSKKSDVTTIDVDAKKTVEAVDSDGARLTETSDSRFHPGQVWGFKSPEGQPNARLTILRVEEGAKVGRIVHIAISGVSYGDGHSSIPHLPFSEAAIEGSVTTLDSERSPLPDYAEGYKQWRSAFDSGKGGVFTISVAKAYSAVTGALPKKK